MTPDQHYPLWSQLVLQLFWLLPVLLSVFLLSGRNQNWLVSRFHVRGWFPWFLLLMAVTIGGWLNGPAWLDGLERQGASPDVVSWLAVLLFVPLPLAFAALFIGVPRFIQPRWIRERLEAGDPVRVPNLPRELWGSGGPRTLGEVRKQHEATVARVAAQQLDATRAAVAQAEAEHRAQQASGRSRRADRPERP